MTTETPAGTVTGPKAVLWSLLFGNFIIGTGVLLPAGLLNDLMADFSIPAAQAGLLTLAGGLVVAIGAPLSAAFTSAIDRRKLLTFSLVLYALGHLGAALVPSFGLEVLLRAITVAGAAIFTPQAAATAGLIVPLQRRAATIAFIFIGWSVASVVGIPLGGLISAAVGWRSVYAGMGLLCLVAALAVWLTLPTGLFVPRLGLPSWKLALGSPVLLVVFMVTLLSMSAQFTLFGYIAPVLKQGFAASPKDIAIAFAVVGISGVIGNAIASRAVASISVTTVIALSLLSLCAGFAIFGLAYGHFTLAMAGAVLWGIGSFSSNSLQQSRLVALAPQLAAATVALNTSVVYLGQSTGAAVGGFLINKNAMALTPWLSFVFMLLALAMSLLATRLARSKTVT